MNKYLYLLSNINIEDYFGLYKNISDHYSVSFNVNIEKYPCRFPKQILKSNMISIMILISIMLI